MDVRSRSPPPVSYPRSSSSSHSNGTLPKSQMLPSNLQNNNTLSKRRSKKPNFNMLKTVQVERGTQGYGFTIAGNAPCYLNCVLRGSSAEAAGLRTGQFIMTVNGENASHWSTGEVVNSIQKCPGVLTLNLAHDDDDSIEDDDTVGTARYKPRRRPVKSACPESSRAERATEEILAGTIAPSYFSSEAGSAEYDDISSNSRYQGSGRLGSTNSAASSGSSYPSSTMAYTGGETRPPPNSCHTSQDQINPQKDSKTSLRHLNSSGDVTSAANSGFYYAMVGYVGSVDFPSKSMDHASLIYTIQGCVRNLQKDENVSAMLLMEISNDSARLINSKNVTIVTVKYSSLVIATVSEEDKRFFGLVVRNMDELSGPPTLTSCLVFMVDPQISRHSVHLKAARKFHLACSRITSNLCKEFPSDSSELVSNLKSRLTEFQQKNHVNPSPVAGRCPSENSNSDSGIILCKDHLCKFCSDKNSNRIFNGAAVDSALSHPASVKSTRAITPSNRINTWASNHMMSSVGAYPDSLTPRDRSTPVDYRNHDYRHFTPYDERCSSLRPGKVSSEHRPLPASEHRAPSVPVPTFHTGSQVISDRCASVDPGSLHKRAPSEAEDDHSAASLSKVASWAACFQNLLDDPHGVTMFTEFLKKEFAEENIMFWQSCQKYMRVSDASQREEVAYQIFHQHLASNCTHPVNIDNQTLHLVSEKLQRNQFSHDLFKDAQVQIFNLMKFDSYSRFLKSDLYKSSFQAEFSSPTKQLQRNSQSLSTMNGENVQHSEDEGKEQMTAKRSLLPWRKKKKASKTASPDVSLQSSERSPDKAARKISQSSESLLSMPDSSFENNSQCKVILPDGNTVLMACDVPHSVGYSMNMLCMQHDLNLKYLDMVLRDSSKPINVNEPVRALAGKEIFLERRVYFKLELPSTQVVGVKSKPNISIKEVFQPLLVKYRLSLNNLVIRLADSPTPLNLQLAVAILDQKRVVAQTIEQYTQHTMEKENLGVTGSSYSRRASSSSRKQPPASARPSVSSTKEERTARLPPRSDDKMRRPSNEEHQFHSSNQDAANHHLREELTTPAACATSNALDTTLQSGQLFGLLSKVQGNRLESQRVDIQKGMLSLSKLDMPSFLDHHSCQSGEEKCGECSMALYDQPLQSTMIQHKPPLPHSGRPRHSKHPMEPPVMDRKLRKEITPIPSNFRNYHALSQYSSSYDVSACSDVSSASSESQPGCPNPSAIESSSMERDVEGATARHNSHESTMYRSSSTDWIDSQSPYSARYLSSDAHPDPGHYPSAASSASSLARFHGNGAASAPNKMNIYHV